MSTIYGFCVETYAPMRAESSECSEMVNQLLFGELFEVLDKLPGWYNVRLVQDNYTGWVDAKMVIIKYNYSPDEWNQQSILVHKKTRCINSRGHALTVLPGSYISETILKDTGLSCDVQFTANPVLSWDEIIIMFINTPYLWGGKSLYGIDCSGLSQVIMRLKGFKLPRDAWKQANANGQIIELLDNASPGDLAFFNNPNGHITHVGIILNNCNILHASGRVRIDRLDKQGIYNPELDIYTHKLNLIVRF